TVLGIIGTANHFFLKLVGQYRHDWTKYFLTYDGHIIAAITKHGRCNECPIGKLACRDTFAAHQQTRTARFTLLDITKHSLHMREANQWPHIDALVQRIAELDTLNTRQDCLFKLGL